MQILPLPAPTRSRDDTFMPPLSLDDEFHQQPHEFISIRTRQPE